MCANIIKIIVLWVSILFFSCCNTEEDSLNCIPNTTINVSINMSLAAYQNLQAVGGWIYYNGSLSGSKGLIIVNTGTGGFKAYDRNAPHICPTLNSQLLVENDIAIICPEDNAKWILTTGQPLEVASRSPISYFVSVNGNNLSITN